MITVQKKNSISKVLTIALVVCYIFPTLIMYHTAKVPTGLDNIIFQLQSLSNSSTAAESAMSTPSFELIRILQATAGLITLEKDEDDSAQTTRISFLKIPHLLPTAPFVAISFFTVKKSPIKEFHCISNIFPPDVPPPRHIPC